MVEYVLAQGDVLRPGVADKIIRDLTHELYEDLPASGLQPLLSSGARTCRLVGLRIALLAGPYAKGILGDVRGLTSDEDPDVQKIAEQVVRQAAAAGWISND